jgi:hypothetical protein
VVNVTRMLLAIKFLSCTISYVLTVLSHLYDDTLKPGFRYTLLVPTLPKVHFSYLNP